MLDFVTPVATGTGISMNINFSKAIKVNPGIFWLIVVWRSYRLSQTHWRVTKERDPYPGPRTLKAEAVVFLIRMGEEAFLFYWEGFFLPLEYLCF